jgi:hypothetical protein
MISARGFTADVGPEAGLEEVGAKLRGRRNAIRKRSKATPVIISIHCKWNFFIAARFPFTWITPLQREFV